MWSGKGRQEALGEFLALDGNLLSAVCGSELCLRQFAVLVCGTGVDRTENSMGLGGISPAMSRDGEGEHERSRGKALKAAWKKQNFSPEWASRAACKSNSEPLWFTGGSKLLIQRMAWARDDNFFLYSPVGCSHLLLQWVLWHLWMTLSQFCVWLRNMILCIVAIGFVGFRRNVCGETCTIMFCLDSSGDFFRSELKVFL